MKVTLQMIADRARVSCAAVSLALRNSPQVSSERREEIRVIADEMGYRPNALVSALMTRIRQAKAPPRHTGLLYLVSGDSPRPGPEWGSTSVEFFLGAKEQAEKRGFNLQPFWLREPGLTERRIERILQTRGIPGVIVGPRDDERALPHLPWERLSVVMISHSFTEPRFDRVSANFYHSVRLAMSHLESGPLRLILPESHDRNVLHLWTASYLQERRVRRQVPPPLIVAEATTAVSWVKANRGCTVLGTNLVLSWLEAAGLRPERDFRFVSLNVEGRADLRGIREPSREVGAEAADLLIGRIYLGRTGIPEKPRETFIEPDWQEGAGGGF